MTWAWLRFALLVGAGLPIALRESKVWEKPPTWIVVGSLVLVLIIGAAEPLVERLRATRMRRERLRSERIRELITAAVVDIAHATSLSCEALGVSLFLARRGVPKFREPFLDRILRVRLSAEQPPSNVRWTRGKGVVGRCWLEETDQATNVAALLAPHRSCDEAGWSALPREVTMGMTYSDLVKTRGKHGLILATCLTPLNRGGATQAVLSLDGPPDAASVLDTRVVKLRFRQLAEDIQRIREMG